MTALYLFLGRYLRPGLFAYTAQVLATKPVSAAIPNAICVILNLIQDPSCNVTTCPERCRNKFGMTAIYAHFVCSPVYREIATLRLQ